jgi:predicted transcriptional regulator
MAVSLRLPDAYKRRIARLAKARTTTPHALMLEAIGEKLDAEEARAEMLSQARRRLARMRRSGAGIPAHEVFAYLEARALGKPAVRPRARKLA